MKKSLAFFAFVFLFFAQNLFASPPSVEVKREEEVSAQSSSETKSSSLFQLRTITFESNASRVQIKIGGTGGFSKVREEKLLNPGRLMLEIPQIGNAITASLGQFTDHILIPRIRLGEYPEKLLIVIDTVLNRFPVYHIQKSDREIVIILEKTSEMVQEAKSRSEIFLAMQRNEPQTEFKLGSEEEGGILFADAASRSSPASAISSGGEPAVTAHAGGGGMQVQSSPRFGNRIVFLLDDRKEYKIFVEDTQTPIHIQKIRPVYEVRGIQSRLNLMGYDTGGVDGDVGSKTKLSLRQFQKESRLPATGSPNQKTQRELKKRFGY